MTIIQTYAQLDRKIRLLRKQEKRLRNEKKYWQDAATYYQAVIDDVVQRFILDPNFDRFFSDK
jgi:hypothetical protein